MMEGGLVLGAGYGLDVWHSSGLTIFYCQEWSELLKEKI
jgi:hypothetical protein